MVQDNVLVGIQSLPYAALPVKWLAELRLRNDNAIISRTERPETQVDYYFDALSHRRSVAHPSSVPIVKWVLDRPESEFAAKTFVAESPPMTRIDLEECGKVLEILARHSPKSFGSRGNWLEKILEVVPTATPDYEKYLLLAARRCEDTGEKSISIV